MNHRTLSKMILSQHSLSLDDLKTVLSRKHPSISFREADTTIALSDRSYHGHSDEIFESATMTITIIGFELWGIGHIEMVSLHG